MQRQTCAHWCHPKGAGGVWSALRLAKFCCRIVLPICACLTLLATNLMSATRSCTCTVLPRYSCHHTLFMPAYKRCNPRAPTVQYMAQFRCRMTRNHFDHCLFSIFIGNLHQWCTVTKDPLYIRSSCIRYPCDVGCLLESPNGCELCWS